MKPENRSPATTSRVGMDPIPTVEGHDVSSRAGSHGNLVMLATTILSGYSSPELTVGSVRRDECFCTATGSHGRLV